MLNLHAPTEFDPSLPRESLMSGERQVAERFFDIRLDHRARYLWAASMIADVAQGFGEAGPTVIDLGCGVGYGSQRIAQGSTARVKAVDISGDAIAYAREHYGHARLEYIRDDICRPGAVTGTAWDIAVAFEVVEHIREPHRLLNALQAERLFVSVPNQTFFPWSPRLAHHERHYTEEEITGLLASTGWSPKIIKHQEGPESEIGDTPGRTIVIYATRSPRRSRATPKTEVAVSDGWAAATSDDASAETDTVSPESIAEQQREIAERWSEDPAHGKHVCIVGLGPTAESYLRLIKGAGGRHAYADEVWAINAMGLCIDCDRIFHMDDVRVQEARAAANASTNIANMIRFMKDGRHGDRSIYTSHPEPGYPGLVEYPLDDVCTFFGRAYFNNTVPYAVAFALMVGAKKVSLFGCDYTYPNAHASERGRACLEYWLALAMARGVVVNVPSSTTLLDACEDASHHFYGYDGYDVSFDPQTLAVTKREKPLPSAEEIEARYDHQQHPNTLARKGQMIEE